MAMVRRRRMGCDGGQPAVRAPGRRRRSVVGPFIRGLYALLSLIVLLRVVVVIVAVLLVLVVHEPRSFGFVGEAAARGTSCRRRWRRLLRADPRRQYLRPNPSPSRRKNQEAHSDRPLISCARRACCGILRTSCSLSVCGSLSHAGYAGTSSSTRGQASALP
ncbi:hypothetical protein EI94DRAFT_1735059 [Lactarius quietus]|nr:hypothetical protein EI94DRAFT_1735059 [Lactarius quietus]